MPSGTRKKSTSQKAGGNAIAAKTSGLRRQLSKAPALPLAQVGVYLSDTAHLYAAFTRVQASSSRRVTFWPG